MNRIPVTVGDLQIGPLEKQYVNEVLNSNRLSYGPFCKRFEEEWAAAHGARYAVFCNSGTSALHIAVAALKDRYGWADGDEVIVPATTFVATANVVLHNNLTPVFVDVDPLTFNMDPAGLPAALTPRTRAVLPVHLLGLPADMPRIGRFAAEHGLAVIGDSCETTFAHIGGVPIGAFGDVNCFSTYMAHYIVTGVGGLATTNDPDLAVRLRSLMNHGRDAIYLSIDDDKGLTGERRREVIGKRFRFEHLGHSFRCTEMEAALGCAQMTRRAEIVARRKAVAARYTAGLADLADVLQPPTVPPGFEHVYMIYPVVLRAGDKAGLVEHLEAVGVDTRDLLPLINQPVYRKRWPGRDFLAEFPVSARLLRSAFYIGCHQFITDAQADHVVAAVRAYFHR